MRRSLLACLAGGLTLTALNVTAAGPRRVLLVHSFGRDFAPFDAIAEQFCTDLARESPEPVEFKDASLEKARSSQGANGRPLVDCLESMSSERWLDLVVTLGGPAAFSAHRHRERLFPDIPMIATMDQRRVKQSGASTNVSGVPLRWKIGGVLALCVIEAGLILALLAQLRQRRRAEGALRESEQRMQLAIEAAAVGLWSWDVQHHRIWASEQARRLYGMTPGEPISFQTFLERVHPEDRQRVEEAVRQVLKGRRLREYYRVIHPDGSQRWLLAIGSLTTTSDRKPERLMGVSLDVTDRKTADEALQRAQALTGAVFDSIPGMLYLYTAEGQLIRWNKKHEELTGYSHDQLARFKAADWFEGEDLTIMTRAWERVFTVGQASAELNLIVKGGAKIPYLLTGVRVEIDGKPHLVGIGIELSERRQAEAKLAQVTTHLAHAYRVGVLGELTSALAHELNQPLAAILSNAQAARRFLAGDEPDLDELRAILDDIVSDDKRAGEIIHRLRAMLRKEPVPRSPCDLNDIVREVLSTLNSELIAQNVLVRTELEPALPPVEVGRVEVQQVLINLLMNAAQAMQDTPSGQRTVTVQTSHRERNILVTVRDRGHGIPKEKLPHVFDPFFTTKASGLGMGLAICRRLIEAHGGSIKAENNPAGGAQFTCSLPVHVAKKQPQNG